MTRDSAETGDPDTLQGQFPSEIQGAGGGGGGTSEPTLITEQSIMEPMQQGGSYPQYFAFRWDSRPIGGTRYGFYFTGNSHDQFYGAGIASLATTVGTASTVDISGQYTLSGDFLIGMNGNFQVVIGTGGSVTRFDVSAGLTGFNQTLFNTVLTDSALFTGFTAGFTGGTGGYFAASNNFPMALPGPYMTLPSTGLTPQFNDIYGQTGMQVGWGSRGRRGYDRRQIFPIPGGSTSFNLHLAATFNTAVSNIQATLQAGAFNAADLDAMNSVTTVI